MQLDFDKLAYIHSSHKKQDHFIDLASSGTHPVSKHTVFARLS